MHVSWNLVDNVYLTNNSKQAENKILEIASVYKFVSKQLLGISQERFTWTKVSE